MSAPVTTAAGAILSVSRALIAGARAQPVGGALYSVAALHILMVSHCEPEHRAFWAARPPQKIAGLIQNEPEVAEQCAAHGVLAWYIEDDRLTRMVNTRWREAHADIRALVAARTPGARACAFCWAPELQQSLQLVPVDAARRGKLEIFNGSVQLQRGVVCTHERCRAHWLKWREIAEQYRTPAEAVAADREAGRVALGLPVPKVEPAIFDPPEGRPHVNSTEQGFERSEATVDTGRLSDRTRKARGEI